MIVQWDSVGYFMRMLTSSISFQLNITNGADPIVRRKRFFLLQDMQWTTGDASGGTNGLAVRMRS